MSTQTDETTSASGDPATPQRSNGLPTPPMMWLLIPVALLALLAFLSRG
jgi:hypothetical protein